MTTLSEIRARHDDGVQGMQAHKDRAWLLAEVERLQAVGQLVCDCLNAAYCEGLSEAMSDEDGPRLVDLLQRRIIYHHTDLQTAVGTRPLIESPTKEPTP
jgi:hypothetical protein